MRMSCISLDSCYALEDDLAGAMILMDRRLYRSAEMQPDRDISGLLMGAFYCGCSENDFSTSTGRVDH